MTEKELLEYALNEINGLRHQNELMKVRLDMFDDIMSALHGQPAQHKSGLMHPDIAHEIRKYLTQIPAPSSPHHEQEPYSETSKT